MSRCTGHCCRRFYLPLSPAELERALEATRAGKIEWVDDAGVTRPYIHEIETIAPMVIYLEPAVAVGGAEPGRAGHHYTCKNLLPNGDCGIYATRPSMCSDYPYGRACTFKECTARPPQQALSPGVRPGATGVEQDITHRNGWRAFLDGVLLPTRFRSRRAARGALRKAQSQFKSESEEAAP